MLYAMRKLHNKENGFTLIELLIVVLIIGILAAIAIPVYLGLQNQAQHNAVKSDVNVTVKTVQVGLTEGQSLTDLTAANTDSTYRSDGAQITTIAQSDNRNFTVTGVQKTDANYAYQYDSTTGKFTETTDGSVSGGNIALGGGNQGSNVAPAITSAKPTATGTVNTAYNYTVTATGTPTPTFTATGLPTGLSLGLTSGVISGTPTTAGTYSYTITVSNNVGSPATQTGNIVIAAAPSTPAFTSAAITAGTSNQFSTYSYQVTASGSPAPTFSITTGALPTGLSIDPSTGLISGTITASGTFNFTITASNGVGTAPTQAGKITVGAAAAMYSTSGSTFDQTWTAGNSGAATSVGYDSTGMRLSVNSTSYSAVAYKDISGFVVGGTYKISMVVAPYGGSGYSNQSGPGISATNVTTGPTSSNIVQNTSGTYTVTYSFTATTTTTRMWALIGNYYGNIMAGYASSYSITRTA